MTTPLSATGAASSTAPTTPTASTPSSTSSATGFDKDTFMKLLVAQLKYQNPMQPTDNSQYMNQMAVFAQVEKLGQLVTAQQQAQSWQQRVSAESLVGKQVTGIDSAEVTRTGLVSSVTLSGATPVLTLTDGSTLSLTDVTTVQQAGS